MKRPITAVAMALLIFGPLACGKSKIATNLALLQHKWNIVSLNGEAFRYNGKPGDYYDFRTDGKLYTYSAGRYDTSIYILADGGRTLQTYHLVNGVPLGGASKQSISKLSASTCILYACPEPVFCSLDSLSR